MTAAGRVHTPFEAPYRMAMGLSPMAPDEWLELDGNRLADLREKRRLLAERHGDVFAATPGSEAAQDELLALLAAYLVRHCPEAYRLSDGALLLPELDESHELAAPGMAPLDLAGRLVQEDLCILQRREEAWHLTAASVCFPTRWNLGAKIGRPLAEIHAPVPGFGDKLAAPVALFFDRIRVDKPVWRLNWSLLDDPALFQPGGHNRGAPRADIDGDNAGEKVTLRVERQTLRRLPESGAVVFTIRIHRWPLSVLADRPEEARRLREAMASMPAGMRGYKSLGVLGAAVDEYLGRILAGPDGGTAA